MLRHDVDVSKTPRKSYIDWVNRGAIIAWLIALAGSWVVLQRYELQAEQPLRSGLVEQWPTHSTLGRATDRPTLVFFLHPKCPCSRASLRELGQVFEQLGSHTELFPELIIVTPIPIIAADDWTETSTVREARRLPSARLFVDHGGVEAARFGANTSGLVMLFNKTGARVYGGGITVARAHEGANAGRDALTQILEGRRESAPALPALGCRLCLPETALPKITAALANSN